VTTSRSLDGTYGRRVRRPLSPEERALLAALLQHVSENRTRFLAQLHLAEVVGGCGCGCPSIDIAVGGGGPVTLEGSTILVGGDATSPEGTPVGVILWVRDHELVSLEVHAWDETPRFGLPRPETLKNVAPGND
jgi:hypothetical protein